MNSFYFVLIWLLLGAVAVYLYLKGSAPRYESIFLVLLFIFVLFFFGPIGIAAISFTKMKIKAIVLIFIALSFLFIVVLGQTITLTCTHLKTSRVMKCFKQTNLIGFIPFGTDEISGVLGATVADCGDCEDGGYRVELMTEQGNVPLNVVYDGTPFSFEPKKDVANRINDFVNGTPDTQQIVVTDMGLFSLSNIIMVLIFALGIFLWRRARRWLS